MQTRFPVGHFLGQKREVTAQKSLRDYCKYHRHSSSNFHALDWTASWAARLKLPVQWDLKCLRGWRLAEVQFLISNWLALVEFCELALSVQKQGMEFLDLFAAQPMRLQPPYAHETIRLPFSFLPTRWVLDWSPAHLSLESDFHLRLDKNETSQ